MGDSSNADDRPSPWASPGFAPPEPGRPDPPRAEPPATSQTPATSEEPGVTAIPGSPAVPQPPAPAPAAGQGSQPYTFPSLEKPPFEPLAAVSLATSPLAPVGLAAGIAAIRRINQDSTRGKGVAATGIILSSLFLAAAVLTIATFALDGTFARMNEQPVAGDLAATRTASPVNLDAGNCVLTLPVTADVGEVTLTPCAEEHQHQVIDRIPVDGDSYPGESALFTQAEGACQAAFDALSPAVESWPSDFTPWHLVPSEENWASGERNIICLARSTAGPVTTDLLEG